MKGAIPGIAKAVPPVKTASPSPTPGTPLQNIDELSRKVAEAKRRVAEAQTKLAVKDNPYMVSTTATRMFACFQPSLQSVPQMGKKNKPVEPAQQGAGLKMTAHPLLLDTAPAAPQSKKDRYKPMQPKFASIKVSFLLCGCC